MRPSLLPLVALSALSTFSGCATSSSKKTDSLPGGIVRRYAQGAAGGHANVYWFDTPSGPVVIDVPLTTSDAQKLRKSMVRPFRIYVTAARPERFGSLATMRQGEVPAYTTTAVSKEIGDHAAGRLAPLHREHGEEVPTHVEAPVPSIEERTHTLVGEVELEMLPLGPAESESSLALYLPKTGELITGDVVAGREHLDLTWGRSTVWQDRIAELKALRPQWIYPGHGTPGGPELLDETLQYLKFFHDAVNEKVKAGAAPKITPEDHAQVKKKILTRYPKLGRADLLDQSIRAEYSVQLSAVPPPAPAVPTDSPAADAAAPSQAAQPETVGSSSAADELLSGGEELPKKGKRRKGKR